MSKEFDFYLNANLKKYEGRYVVILDEKVIASGENAQIIPEEAQQQFPNRLLTLAKIQREGTLIF